MSRPNQQRTQHGATLSMLRQRPQRGLQVLRPGASAPVMVSLCWRVGFSGSGGSWLPFAEESSEYELMSFSPCWF